MFYVLVNTLVQEDTIGKINFQYTTFRNDILPNTSSMTATFPCTDNRGKTEQHMNAPPMDYVGVLTNIGVGHTYWLDQ